MNEVIENQVKVNVGFKCAPKLKTKLSEDAQKLGISLSEYTEGLISKHYNADKQVPQSDKETANNSQDITACFEKFETKLSDIMVQEVSSMIVSIDEIKEMLIEMGASTDKTDKSETFKNLTEQNENLTKELDAITGNEGLQQLYEKYKGKNLNYKTVDGTAKKIKVESYSDIITALVESISDKQ